MATSAGIASMLQASAQSMQLQPRGILGTANLFSFMPTAAPPASADASPPANPESGASTTAENPPPAPPPEAAALPAGGAAAQPVSVQEAGGGAGLAQQNVDWEGAVLLGGEQGAIDQKSLRMEMKTSMDMHRLMRSRQKVSQRMCRNSVAFYSNTGSLFQPSDSDALPPFSPTIRVGRAGLVGKSPFSAPSSKHI